MPPLHTYEDAEAFLNGLVNYEKLLSGPIRYNTAEFDRDTFRELLRRLGDPQLNYAVIHVAGTKGKGSTCAFLESILRTAGYRTGLYTSPHIDRYTERVAVDGKPIPDTDFCRLLSRLSAEGDRIQSSMAAAQDSTFRTVFEFLTAAAFLHFAEERVQVAIVETGLGGRLDSTNVFETPGSAPLINVITSIGYDHTAVLGDTIEKIAAEKAGIMRPHGTAVLSPQPAEWGRLVENVVMTRVDSSGAPPLLCAERILTATPVDDTSCSRWLFKADATAWPLSILERSPLARHLSESGIELTPSLPGTHQIGNLQGVLCALSALEASAEDGAVACPPIRIAPESVESGCATTRWAGRFDVLSSEPLIIVDGAHCPLSARAMAQTFTDLYGPDREVILVAGFLRDKAAEEICAAIKGRLRVSQAIACTPPTPRARAAADTALAIGLTLEIPALAVDDIADAVQEGIRRLAPGQALLVFGSMYLIGPATDAARNTY